jgi:hypothetical protein
MMLSLMGKPEPVIERPEDLSAAWLSAALGGGGEIASFTVAPIGTGQMSDSFRVNLTYAKSRTTALRASC